MFALAATVAGVGVLSFIEYRFEWDPGIDHILFNTGAEDLPGSVRAGLMSPLAAASFCLLGCAVLLIDSGKRRLQNLVQSLTCCSAVISMFGILDFVLDASTTHTHISPLTALVLFLLSFGVMFLRTDYGLSALISSPQSGGRLLRRLLPASIAIPTVIAWLRWQGEIAGFYSAWAGLALTTVTSVALLALTTTLAGAATERAESTQLKASESSRLLAAIVNSSQDAIIGKTLQGIVSSWNAGAEAIYGYSAKEIIGRPVNVLMPADRIGEFEQFLNKIRRGEKVQPRETARICKDGRRIYVSLSVSPITNERGIVVGASTIARDITERKRIEQALAASEERYRSLVTATAQVVWTTDAQGQVVDDMPMWRAFTGMRQDEIMGAGWLQSLHPDDRDRTKKVWLEAWQKRIRYETEYRIRRQDGAYRTFAVRGVPVMENDGAIREWVGTCTDITERKVAEEKLRESSAYARSLIEVNLDPLVTISREGKITDVNQATEKATGVTRDRLIGSDFSNYFTEPERARAGYEQVFSQGLVQDYPLSLQHVSGRARDVLYNAAVYRNRKGEVEGVFAAARDITERKLAEEKAREAGRYVRSLIEASPDPLVTISREGKITDVNQATEKATGVTRDRLIGTDFSNYFTEPEKARAGYERVFSEGVVHDYSLSIRHASGRIMDVLYNAAVYWNRKGEIDGVFAAARDVTEVKRAEELLRQESNFRRNVIEHAAEGLCVCHIVDDFPYVQFTVWNERMQEITGYTMEEINHKGWYQTMYPDPGDQERARQRMLRMRDGDNLRGENWEIRRAGGEIRILQITTSLLETKGGARHILALMQDITLLKKAERELLLTAERLALAQQAGHAGTFDWDMQKNVNIWTREVEEVHGLAAGEFGGRYEDWVALILPEDLPEAKRGIESALKSGEFAGEWRIRRRNDGKIRWIIARAKVLFDDGGKPLRMIGVNMDVTERKEAEEQVRELNAELERRVVQRTAQLEAANKELEAFTYSVSHDLRAPLRHISGFSKILSEEFGPSLPADAQRHLQRIDEGTIRMGQLVDDLLNLARVGRRDLILQAVSLKSLAEEVITMLAADLGDRKVEWKIADLPYVDCDAGLVKQVFQNLLSNAVKFTRPRPHAVIEIGREEHDGTTNIFVRDNGVGFSMKYADKLFGVFQRLHRVEDFEGTGVGLATVQRIVQKHGGKIWAEAELDKGATFYFSIGKREKLELKASATGAGA